MKSKYRKYLLLFIIALSITTTILITSACNNEFSPIEVEPIEKSGEQWKFVIYGDTRSNDKKHREVLQSIVNNSPDYRFIINVGDVVMNGIWRPYWNKWKNAVVDILGSTGQNSIPPKYMSVVGNHDKIKGWLGGLNWKKYLSGQVKQFGNKGAFFILDYENARFIILNSNDSLDGAQLDMLEKAINNNPKTWLFAVWHHPIFPFGDKSYNDKIHETWGKKLYQGGCDIMFMGHAHYYVRTKKVNLDGSPTPPLDPEGTVQIITGNGAAGLDKINTNSGGRDYMVAGTSSDHGYTELTVDGDTLYLRHITMYGEIADEEVYIANPK